MHHRTALRQATTAQHIAALRGDRSHATAEVLGCGIRTATEPTARESS
jgi:hypothetical protein